MLFRPPQLGLAGRPCWSPKLSGRQMGRPHDVEIVWLAANCWRPLRHSFPHEIFEPGNQR